ncbi:hypothetical protein [Acutalibacter sp. 1XD8-33]|uniref:hypothetical protein n=1 Tax=Acutalibacter sp. 1XD8-33 TaxID=2320081 RepID=UPI0011C48718|nr:hypothetical protein [Acutalibacter sp. 1XD8-33]
MAMQDAGIMEIASNPDAYARYLQTQGDNPMYSVGNVALAMAQDAEVTQFGTKERWQTMGRSVLESEKGRGVQIFARSSFGKGYTIAGAYDIRQTQGREPKQVRLAEGSKEMESALGTLLNYSAVPAEVEQGLDVPAYYDSQEMKLFIGPEFSDTESFAAIATEVAHSRFHNKGRNQYYRREECHLDAESVSCILCRRFGVERDMPELSDLRELYNGWGTEDIRQALDCVQDMSKQIGGSIQRGITPQQHTRGSRQPNRRPAR